MLKLRRIPQKYPQILRKIIVSVLLMKYPCAGFKKLVLFFFYSSFFLNPAFAGQEAWCTATMGGKRVWLHRGQCTQLDIVNTNAGAKFCYTKKRGEIYFLRWGTNCK